MLASSLWIVYARRIVQVSRVCGLIKEDDINVNSKSQARKRSKATSYMYSIFDKGHISSTKNQITALNLKIH